MKMFPIQTEWPERDYPPQLSGIPWELIAPHERQALENHCGQNLDKLAYRQGLSACEAIAILEDRPFRDRWPTVSTREEMDVYRVEAIRRLRELNDRFFRAINLNPTPEG